MPPSLLCQDGVVFDHEPSIKPALASLDVRSFDRSDIAETSPFFQIRTLTGQVSISSSIATIAPSEVAEEPLVLLYKRTLLAKAETGLNKACVSESDVIIHHSICNLLPALTACFTHSAQIHGQYALRMHRSHTCLSVCNHKIVMVFF